MPDVNNTELITFENWTLRVRPAEKPGRLLLLIHGLTGDENSMWIFTRGLPSGYWIIAPRAPHDAKPVGYSWRPPQFESLNQSSLAMLKSSVASLLQFVDGYASSVGLDASQFDVLGFSQGAAVANLVAFFYPQRVRKAGILAGFVLDGLRELIAKRPLAGKLFFVAHGTQDEMVPLERARQSLVLLEQAGAQVTYCEDEVGHRVSASCLRALEKFFAE